jgi:hypothetical protein
MTVRSNQARGQWRVKGAQSIDALAGSVKDAPVDIPNVRTAEKSLRDVEFAL